MPLKKPKALYSEGDWFAVPLRNGGYGAGIIARAGRKDGVLFGYFFGPKRYNIPTFQEMQTLKPVDAVLAGQFGDLGLIKGEWPILGHSEDWNRQKWPMPPFARVDEHAGKCWLVEYSEDDPNHELRVTPCDPQDASHYPRDSLMGYGAVEIRLTKLLRDS